RRVPQVRGAGESLGAIARAVDVVARLADAVADALAAAGRTVDAVLPGQGVAHAGDAQDRARTAVAHALHAVLAGPGLAGVIAADRRRVGRDRVGRRHG